MKKNVPTYFKPWKEMHNMLIMEDCWLRVCWEYPQSHLVQTVIQPHQLHHVLNLIQTHVLDHQLIQRKLPIVTHQI